MNFKKASDGYIKRAACLPDNCEWKKWYVDN